MGEETKGPQRDSSGRFLPQAGKQPPEDTAADTAPRVGTGARPENETAMERVGRIARGDYREGEWVEDISSTVAPSVGPRSVAFHHPHEGPTHDVNVDAMGNDKRRQVVGNSYGPSFARQATLYGIFVVIVIALFIGGRIAISHLDKAPATNPNVAPWSAPNAPQHPPKPLE